MKSVSYHSLIQEKINKLTPTGNWEFRPVGKRGRRAVWQEFICDCGIVCWKRKDLVLSGLTKSCGCLAEKALTEHQRIIREHFGGKL